jgi:hypothetical protein
MGVGWGLRMGVEDGVEWGLNGVEWVSGGAGGVGLAVCCWRVAIAHTAT